MREERLRRNLTLEDVAKATKIRVAFLQAIEKGDYQKLPSAAYVQGFVRNYVDFLGLPKRESLALFRREFDEEKEIGLLPEGFTKREVSILSFRIQQTALFIILIFIVISGYLLYHFRYAFISPPLHILYPPENLTTKNSEIIVSGRTDPAATVTVNDIVVSVDKTGYFRKVLTLFNGETIIDIVARHPYGKEARVVRKVKVQ